MRTAAIVAASVGGTLLVGGAAVYLLLLRKPPEATVKADLRAKLLAACAATDSRFNGRGETNRCFADQAELWSKAEYCDAIEPEAGKLDNAGANCRARVARDTGNVELCKKAGTVGATSDCLKGIAERNEDASLCQSIQEPRPKQECIRRVAGVTRQPELCKQILGSRERDECTTEVVRGGASTAACTAIEERRRRNDCVLEGARHGRPDVCLLLDPDDRPACWGTLNVPLDDLRAACGNSVSCLVQLSGYGTEACSLIPDEKAFDRSPCFAHFMQRGGNEFERQWVRDSVCEKQPSASARDECFAALGSVEGRASACARVTDVRLRQNCLATAGKRDPVACKSLTDQVDAKRCVADSSLETLDLSVCQLVEEPKRKVCLARVQSRIDGMVQRGR